MKAKVWAAEHPTRNDPGWTSPGAKRCRRELCPRGSAASRGRAVGEEQRRTATPEGNLPEVFKASQDRIAAS